MQTILVVDDYPYLADLFSDVLAETGRYRSVLARSGPSAAALLEDGGIDLAVVDACLPGEFSGFEVCQRALARRVPSLLITGDPIVAERCEVIGIPWLPKPFHLDELLCAVDRELANLAGNLERVRRGMELLKASAQRLTKARQTALATVEWSRRARISRQKKRP